MTEPTSWVPVVSIYIFSNYLECDKLADFSANDVDQLINLH